jgi:hypothetical protein
MIYLKNIAILKITFFAETQSNDEYFLHLNTLTAFAQTFYPINTPLITFVAQKPIIGELNAEVMYVDDATENVSIKYNGDYLVIDGGNFKELITAGIYSQDFKMSISEKSDWVFSKLNVILCSENFSADNIYRQWNYIEDIIDVEEDCQQPYQAFNDSRSKFYSKLG